MAGSSARSPQDGQSGWTLLRRLGRLFGTPAVSVICLPAVDIPVTIDAVPAGLRVLVADDNPCNLMVASELLGYFGVQVLLAADGAEAVAMAATARLDLILMDLQMPVLDGIGASRQIRRFERENGRARVPVLAYTSVAGNRRQFLEHGIDDVLEKPCEMLAMRECLLRWCPPGARTLEQSQAAPTMQQ